MLGVCFIAGKLIRASELNFVARSKIYIVKKWPGHSCSFFLLSAFDSAEDTLWSKEHSLCWCWLMLLAWSPFKFTEFSWLLAGVGFTDSLSVCNLLSLYVLIYIPRNLGI